MRYLISRVLTHSRFTRRLTLLFAALLAFGALLPPTFPTPQPVLAQTSASPFDPPESFNDNRTTNSLDWGDADGDGDLDLAIGNSNEPIRFYRNNGGVLGDLVQISDRPDGTNSIAWGDVDGDNDLDLAVGNGPLEGDVPSPRKGRKNRLYLNHSTPTTTTFTLGWESIELDWTTSVAWGDLDNDGDLDLAAGNLTQPLRVYRNEQGRLSQRAIWSSEERGSLDGQTYSIALGDADADGKLDLAVGNFGSPSQIYRNTSTSTEIAFAPALLLDSDRATSVAWGDLDGDGKPDLVIGNDRARSLIYRNSSTPDEIAFSSVWTTADDTQATSLDLGDMDGDGDLDLVIGNRMQPTRLYRNDTATPDICESDQLTQLYRNDTTTPDICFTRVWMSGLLDFTTSVALGDLEGDGDLDLLVGNRDAPSRLYRNVAGVLATRPVRLPGTPGAVESTAWGDVEGDGDLDLAVGASGQDYLYLNHEGTLTPSANSFSDSTDFTATLAWGDVEGDGDLDLAVGYYGINNPARLYRNNSTPTAINFDLAWTFPESTATESVAWGDVDGDGDLDLAAGTYVYRNDSTSTAIDFELAWFDWNAARSVAWGDADGDGDLDLAVGTGWHHILYRNDSTQAGIKLALVWEVRRPETGSLAWGDIDGDGNLDIVVADSLGTLRLYRNQSTASQIAFAEIWTPDESGSTQSVALGDVDGDGDLDLAAGIDQQERLYRNESGKLTQSAVWTSVEGNWFSNLAWGDVDGDGDLDLAANTQVYYNGTVDTPRLLNSPPRIALTRPGPTANAGFYSTPVILRQPTIPISYTLSDLDGDPVRFIRAFYSPNGGGLWFPATPAAGTPATNLAAAPTGSSHVFTWNAEADLIKNDTVVFRIEAYQGFKGPGPYQRPYLAAQTFPFRVEATQWFARVVDEAGRPVQDATVYHRGQPVRDSGGAPRKTDRAGLLRLGELEEGEPLLALSPSLHEQPTSRQAHNGWAYHTHLSNLAWATDGQAQIFKADVPGEQRLVLKRASPLVLFNLVISIEWDASTDYLDSIERAARAASDYLYDLTDGQMAFQQVTIYDNAVHWADADIQVSTQNTGQPYAYIGGLVDRDTSHVIHIGRAWDGESANAGPWDKPDGYRTIVHEFGHYALRLYDEYFGYEIDQQGNIRRYSAACTHMPLDPAADAINASAMYDQYRSSELAMRGVPGLWSDACEETAQWQRNGQSDWETLLRWYADVDSARWQFITPADRGSVLAGPAAADRPAAMPSWPLINVEHEPAGPPPRQLTVLGPQGPAGGVSVALNKSNGRVISQGFTDAQGRLLVYGASQNDTLRATSLDGGLTEQITVGLELELILVLNPRPGLATQAGGTHHPHLRVFAEPSPDSSRVDLTVFLEDFGLGATPTVVVTTPGSEVGQNPPVSYSPATGTYEARMSLSASALGTGRIQVMRDVQGRAVSLATTYRLQQVANHQVQDVYSDDGNLHLHLDAGSLRGAPAYLVVTAPGMLPGPPPAGLATVGAVYDLTASGALDDKLGILTMRFDSVLLGSDRAAAHLGLYRWDPASKRWQAVPGQLDLERQELVAQVTALGTYALLAPPAK
jgi:hypothetical protein